MTAIERPPAWAVLAQALIERRPVQARYHDRHRVLCPHALGWKNGRPKVLCYQPDATADNGALRADPRQRWRSMFVDEIEDPTITDGPWQTADNYSQNSNCIDDLEIDVTDPRLRR
jgi:hypothetical protein